MTRSQVVCFGVSHRCAPVEVRERIRFALLDGREFLSSRRNGNGNGNGSRPDSPLSMIRETVLVSTCNRVELYACIDANVSSAKSLVLDLLIEAGRRVRRRAGFEGQSEFEFTGELIHKITYFYEGDEAIRHLCGVACGLDSMVLGETQILTQINQAYEDARDAGLVGPVLSCVFHAAHHSGKKARTLTNISRNASSVGSAAVSLARECVGDLDNKDVAVVGLGQMGQLALKVLCARGASRLHIVNRTVERATAVAEHVMHHTPVKVAVHGIDELPEVLAVADVVITVTGAEDSIVGEDMLSDVMMRRKGRELVIIDIAVPRNVDPQAKRVGGVRLFDTDDIEAVKDSALAARREEIPKVEAIVEQEMKLLESSLRKAELEPLITELRRKAEAIRRRELERAYHKLGSPDPETWSHVQRLTAALVNKLYHYPTNIIKEKATLGKADSYAATIRELFGLSKSGGDDPDDE
jgi:glutamyl-tRNA reductase